MRFYLGPPPDSLSDDELHSGEWNRLVRLPFWVLYLLYALFGLLLAFAVLMAWFALSRDVEISPASLHQLGATMLAFTLIGLWLPVLLHPGMGMKQCSVLGLWLSRLTPYTSCTAKLSKRRMIASLHLPIGVLVVLPLLVAPITNFRPMWLLFGSCYAAATFGSYTLLALLITYKAPPKVIIASRGFHVYWRSDDEIRNGG